MKTFTSLNSILHYLVIVLHLNTIVLGASLTLIRLFLEMLKFSKTFFFRVFCFLGRRCECVRKRR
jgi:hypothetical protein